MANAAVSTSGKHSLLIYSYIYFSCRLAGSKPSSRPAASAAAAATHPSFSGAPWSALEIGPIIIVKARPLCLSMPLSWPRRIPSNLVYLDKLLICFVVFGRSSHYRGGKPMSLQRRHVHIMKSRSDDEMVSVML